MQSTGNDIIALELTDQQRSNDSRFYSKILSAPEKEIHHRSCMHGLGFSHFLWLCWSVKESAYKYLKRKQPGLHFSPVKIMIRHIDIPEASDRPLFGNDTWESPASEGNCYSGSLVAEGSTYYFRSRIYRELIATVVSEDRYFKHTFWGIRVINDAGTSNQSKAVRSFFLNRLRVDFPDKDLRIEKNRSGCPVVFDGTSELPLPVSFAHHGHFIAYSFSRIAPHQPLA